MRELINKIGTFCVKRLAELVGIFIILASIFIFVSLVTYSPEDPNFIFPENTLIKNLMGPKGSFISDLLFQSFGLVSLLIPFTFFFTGLSVAISKKFLSIIENSFFIILYILLACLFFSAFSENSYWLIINGNNGFIGNIYNETYILNLVKRESMTEIEKEDDKKPEPELKTFKFKLPTLDFLKQPTKKERKNSSEIKVDEETLEKILLDFGVEGKINKISNGPVVTLNEFEPAAGVKVSKIIN